MLSYESSIPLLRSAVRHHFHDVMAFRNANWMLQSLTTSSTEKRAIRRLRVRFPFYKSPIYERLLDRMTKYFDGSFYFDADFESPEVPEFFFYSFHSTMTANDIDESEPEYALLYLLLTNSREYLDSALEWGRNEFGLPIPHDLPESIDSAVYMETRIAAAGFSLSLTNAMLTLFRAFNYAIDNPFVCSMDDSGGFTLAWDGPNFTPDDFEQLKREWHAAQPLIERCAHVATIFNHDPDKTLARRILKALWVSILFPSAPHPNQLWLPFASPVFSEPILLPTE